MFQAFLSRQQAKPSGIFGRLSTARWLEKANAGMNTLTLGALALAPGDRLLEVGFGSGYLLEKVLSHRRCGFAAGVENAAFSFAAERERQTRRTAAAILAAARAA